MPTYSLIIEYRNVSAVGLTLFYDSFSTDDGENILDLGWKNLNSIANECSHVDLSAARAGMLLLEGAIYESSMSADSDIFEELEFIGFTLSIVDDQTGEMVAHRSVWT